MNSLPSPSSAFSDARKLSRDEIYSLLARAYTGHVGCYNPSGDHVYIVPVEFVLVGDAVYFFSELGRKTSYMRAHPSGVCFQVDEVAPDSWTSAIIYGKYGEVLDPAERARVTTAMIAKYGMELLDPVFESAGGNPLNVPGGTLKLLAETVLGYILIERASGRSA